MNASKITYLSEDVLSTLELSALLAAIRKYHKDRFDKNQFSVRVNISDYNTKIHDLQEYFGEVKSLLVRNDLRTHHYLWLESLLSLVEILIECNDNLCKNYINISPFELESYMKLMESIGPSLNQLASDFGILLERFLSSEVLSIDKLVSSQVFEPFQELLYNSLEMLVIDRVDDTSYLNFSEFILVHIQQCLVSIFEREKLVVDGLPLVTQFVRVIYMVGESHLLLALTSLPVIDPKYLTKVIDKSEITLNDILHYYKYVALNYLTLSILESSVEYNRKADVYFKVLLYFPNLSKSLFPYGDGKSSKGFERLNDNTIGLLERQEISLMFIMNSLLKLTEIQQYFKMSDTYNSELLFLKSSLSYVLSDDLDKSASRPGSTHSSAISVPKINQLEQQKNFEFRKSKIVSSLRVRSLSYIILLGSYKEKLTYIIQFLNNLPRYEKSSSIIPSHSDIEEGDNSSDELSLGKSLFLTATKTINQSFPKLSYKFLTEDVGIDHVTNANEREPLSSSLVAPTLPVDQIIFASTSREMQNIAKKML
ncbi:hypothetical protein DFJ63DRAFT_58050 [Scheffersomyces coipomensis]|uniref:uncharacterized protein n=1 Tax=Scheffersomyces coipomensis TaxID=1788519 RepID=UPI00315CB35A